ncbi:hypothetical protein CKAH01_16953 [Colletotrichum kahawae]|uniref:Uncharacterized protein n=1 Tax=Colletotrichum kahawae TaxID=34407 RepID=A0AAE0D5X1_COLKA|nr:hypothetical protein CKAH01_16953 [Colletotrichum kahawae]
MCWQTKTLYTACAHSTWSTEKCPNSSAGQCSLCKHTRSLHAIIGFCDECVDVYTEYPERYYGAQHPTPRLPSSRILKAYWSYRQQNGWDTTINATDIPPFALFIPPVPQPVTPSSPMKSPLSPMRNFLSSLKHPFSSQPRPSLTKFYEKTLLRTLHIFCLTSDKCRLCRESRRSDPDFTAKAEAMREQTILYTESLGESDAVIHKHVSSVVDELSIWCGISGDCPSPRQSYENRQVRQRAQTWQESSSQPDHRDHDSSRLQQPFQMPQQTPGRRLSYPASNLPSSPPRSPRSGATYANGEVSPLSDEDPELRAPRRRASSPSSSNSYASSGYSGQSIHPQELEPPYPRQSQPAAYDQLEGRNQNRHAANERLPRFRRQYSDESNGEASVPCLLNDYRSNKIVTAVREAKPKTVRFVTPSPSVSSEEDSQDDPRIVTGSIYKPPGSSPQEPPQPPPKSPLRQRQQERPGRGQLPAATPPPQHSLPEIPATAPLRLSAYGVSGSQSASPSRTNTSMQAEASSSSSSVQRQPAMGLGDQTFGSDPRSPSGSSESGTSPSRGRPTVNIRDCRIHGETYEHGCEWCHTDPIVRVVEIPRWDEYVPAWRRMNRPRQT